MKQHINQQQLSQLTDKGRERLIDYWSTRADDLYERGLLPQYFRIGDMIEFLGEYVGECNINIYNNIDDWILFIEGEEDKKYQSEELCDTLWSACVEVLNKE